MAKKLSELTFGEAILDMHDGVSPEKIRQMFGPGVELALLNRFPQPEPHRVIEKMIESRLDAGYYTYHNKLLVLVGKDDYPVTQYTFAYGYDGRTLGFVVLTEK